MLLRNTFKSIMELVEFRANEKKLQLFYYFSPEVPDYVFVDNSRFTQIMLNIISNAVKFTQKGFVKVIVTFSPENCEEKPLKKILKRNSCPDYIHQHNNELLQIVSHGSNSSSLLKDFNQLDLTVKRSLLHIPHHYFLDCNPFEVAAQSQLSRPSSLLP